MKKHALTAGVAFLVAHARADNYCASGLQHSSSGQPFCKAVDRIAYTNFGTSGSYNKVVSMDTAAGTCTSEPFSFSGSLAPLNEEVSMIFRGPMRLKQFAVYTPGSSAKKSKKQGGHHGKKHNHAHVHKREDAPGYGVPAIVAGETTSSKSGAWTRSGYYNAEQSISEGLSFLNPKFIWEDKIGGALGYAGSDGVSGASSPQILGDALLPTDAEITIMTDRDCSGNSCGVTHPGGISKHGFGGARKVFFAELSMPQDGKTDGTSPNMPAWWMLNAQLSRVSQYAQDKNCKCWPECGEFDLLEVHSPGDTRCSSFLHTVQSNTGGDSNYIERPVGAPVKVAVVMDNNQATIQKLDPFFEFSKNLDGAEIQAIVEGEGNGLVNQLGTSLFALP